MSLGRIEGDLWEIPREGRMKVPGRVYTVGPPAPDDPALQQVANVAHLPGVLRFSRALPRRSDAERDGVLSSGARWAMKRGFAAASDDAERCEEGGRLAGADASEVGERARARGGR